MKRKLLSFYMVVCLCTVSSLARAVDGIYLGGQVGYTGLSGDYSKNFDSNLGFGFDLGFRTNSLIDLNFGFQYSTHAYNTTTGLLLANPGSLSLMGLGVSAELHVARAYDFDFTLGAGPGFYIFKAGGGSSTKFGFNFGGACDLIVADNIKVGVGTRYYAVMGTDSLSTGSFWNVVMRMGYTFDL